MVVITLKFWKDNICKGHISSNAKIRLPDVSQAIHKFLNITKYDSVKLVTPILMENDEWTIGVTFDNPKQETLFRLEYSEYITAVTVKTIQDDYNFISVLG